MPNDQPSAIILPDKIADQIAEDEAAEKRRAFSQRLQLAIAIAPICIKKSAVNLTAKEIACDVDDLVRAIIKELEK